MSTTSPTALLPDLAAIREDFPILQASGREGVPLIYLDNAATAQRPRAVIQAMVEVYERHYANVHRGIHYLSDQSTDLYEEAREKVARMLHAPSSREIVFTTGTTMGINLLAHTWGDVNIGPGDRVLVTEMEHHANLVPWQQLVARRGGQIEAIPLDAAGMLDSDAYRRLLESSPKLVAFTAMSNVLGTINPVKEMTRMAHDAGAIVVVDAAQSVPHDSIDIRDWDVDFLVFSGHKMMGPSGIGVLYGKEALLEAMPPFLGGGNMIRRVRIDGFEPAELPAKFEAGTPPIVDAIGLGAAIDYQAMIGVERIAGHCRALLELAHATMLEIPGLRILGPDPKHKGAIVGFTLEGVHPHDIAQILDTRGIAIRAGHHCAMPLHKRLGITASSRASFYFYNTPGEVQALVNGLRATLQLFRGKKCQI